MSYVDSHCHLNLKKFSKIAEASSSDDYSIGAIVERAKNANVEYILNIGTELSDIEEMQAISASHDNVFHTIGVHPLEAQKHYQQYSLDEISRIINAHCNNTKCVGIGEIGLDYYYTKESAKEQKELFELQLANVTLDPKMASPPSETYARCTCNAEAASSRENACAASTSVTLDSLSALPPADGYARCTCNAEAASARENACAASTSVTLDSLSALPPAEGYARCTCNAEAVSARENACAASTNVGIQNNFNSTPASKTMLAYLSEGNQAENGSNVTLAVCIHSREAESDTIAILRNHPGVTGVIHCFSGSKEFAFQALDLGFYISISGVITFKSNTALQEIVKSIPLDRLLVETDAPFLAPAPFRGKVNEPAFVVHTAKKIAELLGVTEEEVASRTSKNFFKLYSRAKVHNAQALF